MAHYLLAVKYFLSMCIRITVVHNVHKVDMSNVCGIIIINLFNKPLSVCQKASCHATIHQKS